MASFINSTTFSILLQFSVVLSLIHFSLANEATQHKLSFISSTTTMVHSTGKSQLTLRVNIPPAMMGSVPADVGDMTTFLSSKNALRKVRFTNLPTSGLKLETQCPGQCAWPFHQPIYGPQGPALVAPNNDVGSDGMVMNLASLLAGTVTNPFGNGYYQGPADVPLEAASACPGVYGSGAYPDSAGNLLVDPTTGASYNVARGANGRKF
ncbi:hypothetical protein HAX54_017528 [Datura stramonium]|uniref:Uncharacterized protein n=1 Tax=Datura stramonium TaxID=4076 RepID=A0ABS8UKY9_DATST|nr:hypothetical protein [Datura stramonium]